MVWLPMIIIITIHITLTHMVNVITKKEMVIKVKVSIITERELNLVIMASTLQGIFLLKVLNMLMVFTLEKIK